MVILTNKIYKLQKKRPKWVILYKIDEFIYNYFPIFPKKAAPINPASLPSSAILILVFGSPP